MPFDKHIIGQVPAVIRAAFNVSKLQKEDGDSGAKRRLPCPHPLTSSGPRGRDRYRPGCPRVQLWFKASWGSVIPGAKAQGRSTRENNPHSDVELSAGRLDPSVLLQGCDRGATLSCLLNMFH